jgi:glyoxylase-like metal-dependent hydrolase (beta-lactamase superfamily II)
MVGSDLDFQVRISPSVPEVGTEPVPHGFPAVSSPMSTTLICGKRDAVLIDPPWHRDAVAGTIGWIRQTGRRLRSIYITHGHGDHWLGASSVAACFPQVEVRATMATTEYMYSYSRLRQQLWDDRFPGLVAEGRVTVRPTDDAPLELEGASLDVIELGHTDTDSTTALWVPSIMLLVAGDAVYDHCHLALNEAGDGGAGRWIDALQRLAELRPAHVVAGHAAPSTNHHPDSIWLTRQYILDLTTLLETDLDAIELFDAMIERYPDHLNPKALWRSIRALQA